MKRTTDDENLIYRVRISEYESAIRVYRCTSKLHMVVLDERSILIKALDYVVSNDYFSEFAHAVFKESRGKVYKAVSKVSVTMKSEAYR